MDDIENVPVADIELNIGPTKTGPKDFEILRVLGKGGYGKVSILKVFCYYSLQLVIYNSC